MDGSVACSASMSRTTSTTPAPRAAGARWWRTASRARRSADPDPDGCHVDHPRSRPPTGTALPPPRSRWVRVGGRAEGDPAGPGGAGRRRMLRDDPGGGTAAPGRGRRHRDHTEPAARRRRRRPAGPRRPPADVEAPCPYADAETIAETVGQRISPDHRHADDRRTPAAASTAATARRPSTSRSPRCRTRPRRRARAIAVPAPVGRSGRRRRRRRRGGGHRRRLRARGQQGPGPRRGAGQPARPAGGGRDREAGRREALDRLSACSCFALVARPTVTPSHTPSANAAAATSPPRAAALRLMPHPPPRPVDRRPRARMAGWQTSSPRPCTRPPGTSSSCSTPTTHR